ncbi:MAG: NUDIX domain-containing protein [Polyangiaceae bacterium]
MGDRGTPLAAIEPTGRHHVGLDGERLVVASFDERDRLGEALRRHLSLEGGALRLGEQTLGVVAGDALRIERRLTAFQCRFLADHDLPLAAPRELPWSPRTDLHTHFAGALSGEELVALAHEHDHPIPAWLWAEAGVAVENAERASDPETRARLSAALDVPLDRQITFLDMETLYSRRAPLTKAPRLFVPQLHAIARRLSASGVCYAELSLSSCAEPGTLEALHEHLDAVERDTGVRLRMLMTMSRHDDPEWDLDRLARLEQCLESRAIVGVDFAGHETNSTRAFAPILEAVGRLGERRPGFVVRVHAGENPAFPENVRVALETLAPFDGLEVRIGHGIYGVDPSTLALLAQREGAVVEVNLTSNFALNNVDTAVRVPLLEYLDAGIAVVLGTDGAGLYATSARDEAAAAALAGAEERHARALAEVEAALLARKENREQRCKPMAAFAPPPALAPRHYTPEVAQRIASARVARDSALEARLTELGRPIHTGADLPIAKGTFVVWLTGAWKNAALSFEPSHVAAAEALVDAVVDAVARRGGALLTGGTLYGVEAMVHASAARAGVPVLGAIAAAIEPAALDPRVSTFWRCASTLYEKAGRVVPALRAREGFAVFIGGGVVVMDELQAALNFGIPSAVARGFPGPAATSAQAGGKHHWLDDPGDFERWATALTSAPRLRHVGANDAVDVVVLRGDEVLLVRRHEASAAAGGAYALPGGFVLPGETPRQAAARKLEEETRLVVEPSALIEVCVVEGGQRDPRDTEDRWVRSSVFSIHWGAQSAPHALRAPPIRWGTEHTGALVAGGDTTRVLFAPRSRLPPLGFDHRALIERAFAHQGAESAPPQSDGSSTSPSRQTR